MTLSQARSPVDLLVESALRNVRRERKRGHHRKVMLLLRKAVLQGNGTPGLWNRYALACVQQRQWDDARRAFSQAMWLDKSNGNPRRAAITRKLFERATADNTGFSS